ncbi:MAG TPA: WXG100 family type VII secretion target [Pseudonocardiaceae bacterium]|nr:WXG100 family type VII secretion target [Pseudonocardiaceae bacterium]
MSVLADSGTVDLSGVVGSILRNYQNVLQNCLQVVTGDPAALTQAASSASDQANNLSCVAGTVQQQAQSLSAQWEGNAFDAFSTSTGNFATELDAVHDTLVQESQRLTGAATALTNAKSAMDSVLSQFTSAANQLLSESSAASPAAVNAFINAAEQLGQSAVRAATSIIEQLGSALAGIFGLATESSSEAKEGGEKGEEGGEEKKKFGASESDQKKAMQKWLANQPWFKDWYKSTYGKNPDPEHLKFGALNWFDQDDVIDGRRRPKSAPWSTFGNSDWYKVTTKGLLPTSAPLKADTPFGSLADPPEDASTAQKLLHDSNMTIVSSGDHDVYNGADNGMGYEAKDSGKVDLGSYGTLAGKSDFDAGLHVTDNASLNVHGGQLQATADLKGTLLDANASGTYKDGILGADGKVDGFVGGDLSGHLTGGVNGVELHVNGFAGAQVSGSASADVGGLGVGVNGSLQAGVGAQLDGQATWNNGDVKVNFKAGAALGLGASVGGNVEVNLPKMWDNVQQYGSSVANSVSSAASSAADAIGRAASNAPNYWGGW